MGPKNVLKARLAAKLAAEQQEASKKASALEPSIDENYAEREQLIHDLEQKHLLLVKEHEIEKSNHLAAKSNLTQYQAQISDLRLQLETAVRQSSDKDLDLKLKENALKDTEHATEELRERALRKSEECDRYWYTVITSLYAIT